MLCLKRKVGESIVIAGAIKVTVVSVSGQQALRLGVTAPEEIRIDREEIYLERMAKGIDDTIDLLSLQDHNE